MDRATTPHAPPASPPSDPSPPAARGAPGGRHGESQGDAGPSLSDAIEALRLPLRLASKDGFAGLDALPDLAGALRAGAIALSRVASPVRRGPLETWARDLGPWARSSRVVREALIARGMRLVAMCDLDRPPERVVASDRAVSDPVRSATVGQGTARRKAPAAPAPPKSE